MKTKVFIVVLFTLAFSQLIMAQENDFSFSIGVPFNMLTGETIGGENITGEYRNGSRYSSCLGVNLNIMFFKNSAFGYYINMYGFSIFERTISGEAGIWESDEYLYFGVIPGIGYKKVINNNLSFFTGIGPDIRFSYLDSQRFIDIYRRLPTSQLRCEIGGTLEARLQLIGNLSFAGGALIRSNFFDRTDDYISVYPYIGFSWN